MRSVSPTNTLQRTTKRCACHDFLVVVSVIISSGLVEMKFFRNVEKSLNLVSCVVLEWKGNISFKCVLYNNARRYVHVILNLILQSYGPIHLTYFKKTGLQLCNITTTNSPSPRQDNSSRLYKTAISYPCSQNSALDPHAEVNDYISSFQTLFLLDIF